MNAGSIRAIARGAEEWPEALEDLADPPDLLHVRGRLPDPRAAVAIVGSRAATPYGRAQARRLAADLVRLGWSIVSGLARGIDAAAHRGALEAGGASVAIVPCGLDQVTPRHHEALAESLLERGGLASEIASGPPPGKGAFVKRNRLIAALSAATVVVEAAERSGSLSTAAAAKRMRRPVLAVPGDLDRETSRGTNDLIRGGARLCRGAADVIEVLGGVVASTPAARLAACLDAAPRSLDPLARAARLATPEALAALLELEWSGVARAEAGQRWRRAPA